MEEYGLAVRIPVAVLFLPGRRCRLFRDGSGLTFLQHYGTVYHNYNFLGTIPFGRLPPVAAAILPAGVRDHTDTYLTNALHASVSFSGVVLDANEGADGDTYGDIMGLV